MFFRALFFLYQVLLYLAVLLVFALPAASQDSAKQLAVGMTTGDVVSRWGEPTEKINYELRGQQRWLYSHGEVLFEAGKVLSWDSISLEQAVLEPTVETPTMATSGRGPKDLSENDLSLQDLLADIVGK